MQIVRNDPGRPLGAIKKIVLVLAGVAAVTIPVGAGVWQESLQPRALRASQSERVYRPGRGIEVPKLIREMKPDYPDRPKNAKIQGSVLIECVVRTDGTVGDIEVVRELDPELDQAAIDAARQWLFEPGKRDGEPVPVVVVFEIAFTLR